MHSARGGWAEDGRAPSDPLTDWNVFRNGSPIATTRTPRFFSPERATPFPKARGCSSDGGLWFAQRRCASGRRRLGDEVQRKMPPSVASRIDQ